MGCKLLEIMADVLYVVFHRFEAFLKKRLAHTQRPDNLVNTQEQ